MWRKLTEAELQLMTALLSADGNKQSVLTRLTSSRVKEMDDGGMGSLKFEPIRNGSRHLGKTISQAEFLDEDGIKVSVAINLDQRGDLYELDVWKVDFSPLKRWPSVEGVVVK